MQRWFAWSMLIHVLVGAACGPAGSVAPGLMPHAGPRTPLEMEFEREAEAFYWAYFDFRPAMGISLGHHRYDGQLPDRSPQAIASEMARLHRARKAFERFPPEKLSAMARVEHAVIMQEIRKELFDLEVMRSPWRNPRYYLEALDLSPYISRDYRPIEERALAIIHACRAASAYLGQARLNLEDRVPLPWLETTLAQVAGATDFVRVDIPKAMASVTEEPLARDLAQALASMAEELTDFERFLGSRRSAATSDFALGEDRFLRMLSETQGLTIRLADLKRIASADLDRNLRAMKEAARSIDAKKSMRGVVLEAAEVRPAPGEVLELATRQAQEARQFLVEKDLVTIPSEDLAEVQESPPFMRWNAAFLSAAGVFETKRLSSFYYISPPDPSWSKEEQTAYLIPRADLLFTTIHELWPGHFLQSLHSKRNPSRILKSFCTYSNEEGWAHYAEEMAWNAGMGHGDPRLRVGQLKEALLRNARFLVAIGLHAERMTVEQATSLFQDKAFVDPANARQQAMRGTFDPMYVSYTLGKLMIMKLYEDWRNATGKRGALKEFHDAFLSHGCAPIPVIRQAMLGPGSGPAL
ncbi:MAG: DUF885 domain-containing protein [Deltaproteobacteria bacterium]|nr:DUF885 domain-containing protein [Deltaproteobacteria bacterium]